MKVIIINGSGGVGKDMFIEYFTNYAKRVSSFSTVDIAKEIATKYFEWNGVKSEESRLLLSDIKDFLTNHGNIPFKDILKKIDESNSEYIFIHCREPKEIAKLETTLNAITLLVTSTRIKEIKINHADGEVLNYKYDYHIANDGTLSELSQKAKDFYEEINSIENKIKKRG